MHILHIAALDFDRFQSGPTQSVPNLVHHQNATEGNHACLLNILGDTAAPPWFSAPLVPYTGIRDGAIIGVPASFQHPDLAVFHSTYIPAYRLLRKLFRRNGTQYVITPRGGMTVQAQALNRLKKLAANWWFFDRLVEDSLAIHCLTHNEAAQIRRWKQRSFVVGNGIELPAVGETARPGCRRNLILTFVGRTDVAHKGLDLLLEGVATAQAELRRADAQVHIYGPDDKRGGLRLMRQMIERAAIGDIVKLPGPVWGAEKQAVFQQSDAFVLTSRFEGHPMGLLEAMAYGLPVLVTPGTNMASEVSDAAAGWVVPASAGGIAAGLAKLLAERAQLGEYGRRARGLIETRFTWNQIATETIEQYQQLLYAAHGHSGR